MNRFSTLIKTYLIDDNGIHLTISQSPHSTFAWLKNGYAMASKRGNTESSQFHMGQMI